MSAIVMVQPADFGDENRLKELERMDKLKRLEARLAELRNISDKTLVQAANVCAELDAINYDWKSSPFSGWPVLPYLRKIGHGQVLPELVLATGTNTSLLGRAAKLPIPEQRRIANNEKIDVVEGSECRLISPLSMGPKTMQQVFANDRIRSEEEQRAFIREQQARIPVRSDAIEIREDRKRRGFYIEGKFITRSDLALKLEQYGFREI